MIVITKTTPTVPACRMLVSLELAVEKRFCHRKCETKEIVFCLCQYCRMVWVVTAENWLETLSYEDNSEQLEHKCLLVNCNERVGKLYIFNVIKPKSS